MNTFTCPRCRQELKWVPDGCRDPQCPRDTLEHMEAEAALGTVREAFDRVIEEGDTP